jgi:hypothetical protein
MYLHRENILYGLSTFEKVKGNLGILSQTSKGFAMNIWEQFPLFEDMNGRHYAKVLGDVDDLLVDDHIVGSHSYNQKGNRMKPDLKRDRPVDI